MQKQKTISIHRMHMNCFVYCPFKSADSILITINNDNIYIKWYFSSSLHSHIRIIQLLSTFKFRTLTVWTLRRFLNIYSILKYFFDAQSNFSHRIVVHWSICLLGKFTFKRSSYFPSSKKMYVSWKCINSFCLSKNMDSE